MSNLMLHAEQELKRAGYTPDADDELDRNIYKETMMIVQHFAACGHSGGSAWAHMGMIQALLSFKPLGPLTDDPDEWMDVSEFMGETGCWQNRRDGRMFSDDGGKTYYSVDELRTGWRRRLFGRRGKTYTSEPARVTA